MVESDIVWGISIGKAGNYMKFVWVMVTIPSDSDVPEIYTSKKKALANLNAEIEFAKEQGYKVEVSEDCLSANWTTFDEDYSVSVRKAKVQ